METEIIAYLKQYIKEIKFLDLQVELQSSIVDDLSLDSLDMVEIGVYLNERYNLNLDEDKFSQLNFKFVYEIIDFVNSINNKNVC